MNDRLLDAITNMDDSLIEAYCKTEKKLRAAKRQRLAIWRKGLSLAACFAVMVGIIYGAKLYFKDKSGFTFSGERYRIASAEGNNFFTIDTSVDLSKYSQSQLGSLSFDSVEAFVNTVTKGNLSDKQLAIVDRAFPRDENGNILICDFSDISAPRHPKEFTLCGVHWSGTSYGYHLENPNGVFATIQCLARKDFDRLYEEDYVNFFKKDTVTLTEEVIGEQKSEYYFSTSAGTFRSVRYTVQSGSNSLIVEERYCLSASHDLLTPSETVPQRICVYGKDVERQFVLLLFDLTEKPSVSWLSQFGLTKYKP